MSLQIKGLKEFLKRLDKAINGGLKNEMGLWLEALGFEFLDIVQDEIIRTNTVDTRRLLNSFDRSDEENMWVIREGGLSLEIGTNVEYASFVNDGHWTTKEGVEARWVPGRWIGDDFEYDPDAKTGMLLKRKWVEGTHYWDHALLIFERIFEKSLDRKLQQWLDKL